MKFRNLVLGIVAMLLPIVGISTAANADSGDGGIQTVSSTAYGPSEGGVGQTGAKDNPLGDGAVAVNGVPLGTRFEILSGSMKGKIVTVKDHNDGRTDFDIWVPSSGQIDGYGRQEIKIKRLN